MTIYKTTIERQINLVLLEEIKIQKRNKRIREKQERETTFQNDQIYQALGPEQDLSVQRKHLNAREKKKRKKPILSRHTNLIVERLILEFLTLGRGATAFASFTGSIRAADSTCSVDYAVSTVSVGHGGSEAPVGSIASVGSVVSIGRVAHNVVPAPSVYTWTLRPRYPDTPSMLLNPPKIQRRRLWQPLRS